MKGVIDPRVTSTGVCSRQNGPTALMTRRCELLRSMVSPGPSCLPNLASRRELTALPSGTMPLLCGRLQGRRGRPAPPGLRRRQPPAPGRRLWNHPRREGIPSTCRALHPGGAKRRRGAIVAHGEGIPGPQCTQALEWHRVRRRAERAKGGARREAASTSESPEPPPVSSFLAQPHTTALPSADAECAAEISRAAHAGICLHQRGKPPRYQPLATWGTGRAWLSRARTRASSNEVPPAASPCERGAQGLLEASMAPGGNIARGSNG